MTSLFLGVYTAIYDYTAQSDKAISFAEGDLLCVLEKPADDDWWKAKRKGSSVDDEEPTGLIPNNYIEEAKPTSKYKALYDYTQQTDEELSFSEDDVIDAYDTSDPDWVLGGLHGRYGFVPANYVEKVGDVPSSAGEAPAPATAPVKKHVAFTEERESPPHSPSPARLPRPSSPARVSPVSPPLPDRSVSEASQPPRRAVHSEQRITSPSSSHFRSESTYSRDDSRDHGQPAAGRHSKPPKSPQFVDSGDESDGPGLPLRRPGDRRHGASSPTIPPGFRTYPVMEVDSRKKRAATLGLGPNRLILVPDKSSRPREEWTIDDLTGYNHEGKHVFLELQHPDRSLDLHAGSTSAAEEIVSALGELRGLRKASGLDEVIAAATSGKTTDIGTVLYDFPAQGEDEVSVTAGDEVIILDASNDEWWLVRRQVNGAEGVLPSSYVERGRKYVVPVVGIKESPAIRSEARNSQHIPIQTTSPSSDVGASGVPERRSSLAAPRKSAPAKLSMPLSRLRYRKERPSGEIMLTHGNAEPDTSQIRTWTDRTGSFKVEAQFLGCRDGKIHLHKVNGVKIAVPVSKMSATDLRYVEDRTGISLDEDKPLSEIMKAQRKQTAQAGIVVDRSAARSPGLSPAFPSTKKNDYDWFEFFLSCGVDVNNCHRYSTNFRRDEMDESSLEDITSEVMRTLGLKEGDILRVRKKLDEKFGRLQKNNNDGGDGKNLFTDENGNLKSTRTRPPPAIQTGAVDPKALQAQKDSLQTKASSTGSKSPALSATQSATTGFDDDAWAPKPTKAAPQPAAQPTPQPAPQPASELVPVPPPPAQQPAPQPTQPTGALSDIATLSLDTPPLQPTVKSPPLFVPPPSQTPPAPASTYQPQLQNTGGQASSIMAPSYTGSTIISQPGSMYSAGRTRPSAPAITGSMGIAPPPTRPLGVPQNFAQAPMAPMFTGAPNQMTYTTMGQFGLQGAPPPTMVAPSGGMAAGGMAPQMAPQIGFQSTGFAQIGQFPNGGFSQPGYQMPMMTGMPQQQPQQPQQPPQISYTMFPSAPQNNGTFGINRSLPPALIPQLTAAAPLRPQPTGPAPPVRFGLQAKKLAPQPTGRANLTKATPDNPFGF